MASEISKEDTKKSIRLLLLQAWRERWSDIEWGIQLKKILPEGTSGDVYNLSELILSQALVGFSPNALMLTYLQNAVSSHVVSLGASLRAVVAYDDVGKPHCIKTLMEMVRDFLPNAVSYGNSEDPLRLAKCLLVTLQWTLSCAHKSVLQLADNQQNPEFGAIVDLMCQIVKLLLEEVSSRALIAIAASDEADTFHEIKQTESNVRGTLAQITNNALVTQTQRQNVDASLKLLSKINDMGQESCGVLTANFLHNPTVNVIIQQEAILNPVGAIEPIVDLLKLVEKLQCSSRPKLLCDVIRAGFLGIIDVIGGPHELKWVAFTFLKIPQIFDKLQSHAPNACENMEKAFQILFNYSALIEALESKYISCICIQLLLDLMTKNKLLSEEQSKKLLSSDAVERYMNKPKPIEPSTQSTPTLIIRAEPTVASILKTLDADYSKNQEALFGVLCHMMSGKSFELILAASAANGKLRNFALKLLRFNEFAKSSPGEGSRASITRSQLFDISFLMLCHIAQFYGLEIMENREATTEPFFYTWAFKFLPTETFYKSPDSYKQVEPAKVEALLSQISVGGELKTSLVRWFDVCSVVPMAIREVLYAWEAGAIQEDQVKGIVDNLKSRLGCLAVVACAWLCSYVNIQAEECREKPKRMIDFILTQVPSNQATDQPVPKENYAERGHLMYTVCTTMTKDTGLETDGVERILDGTQKTIDLLQKTLKQVYKEGCVKLKSVEIFDTLLSVGGVEWFCRAVLTEMLSPNHPEDLNQAVALTLGIFQLNIKQLTLCFLIRTLPKFLHGSDFKLQILVDPRGRALAKFAVMLISAAVQMRPYQKKFPGILKRGDRLRVPDIDFDPVEKKEEAKPAKQRKEEVLTLQSEFNFQETEFDLQENMDDSEHYDTKDKLNQAMVNLFALLSAIVEEPILSPRNSFIVHFIQESVRCGPHSRYILQFMSNTMLQNVQKGMPGAIDVETLLIVSDIRTARGRTIAANTVCQARRQQGWQQPS